MDLHPWAFACAPCCRRIAVAGSVAGTSRVLMRKSAMPLLQRTFTSCEPQRGRRDAVVRSRSRRARALRDAEASSDRSGHGNTGRRRPCRAGCHDQRLRRADDRREHEARVRDQPAPRSAPGTRRSGIAACAPAPGAQPRGNGAARGARTPEPQHAASGAGPPPRPARHHRVRDRHDLHHRRARRLPGRWRRGPGRWPVLRRRRVPARRHACARL